jgi:hypothetical protein
MLQRDRNGRGYRVTAVTETDKEFLWWYLHPFPQMIQHELVRLVKYEEIYLIDGYLRFLQQSLYCRRDYFERKVENFRPIHEKVILIADVSTFILEFSCVSGERARRDPPERTIRFSAPRPSVPYTNGPISGAVASTALISVAAAASPKIVRTLLSRG